MTELVKTPTADAATITAAVAASPKSAGNTLYSDWSGYERWNVVGYRTGARADSGYYEYNSTTGKYTNALN